MHFEARGSLRSVRPARESGVPSDFDCIGMLFFLLWWRDALRRTRRSAAGIFSFGDTPQPGNRRRIAIRTPYLRNCQIIIL